MQCGTTEIARRTGFPHGSEEDRPAVRLPIRCPLFPGVRSDRRTMREALHDNVPFIPVDSCPAGNRTACGREYTMCLSVPAPCLSVLVCPPTIRHNPADRITSQGENSADRGILRGSRSLLRHAASPDHQPVPGAHCAIMAGIRLLRGALSGKISAWFGGRESCERRSFSVPRGGLETGDSLLKGRVPRDVR